MVVGGVGVCGVDYGMFKFCYFEGKMKKGMGLLGNDVY